MNLIIEYITKLESNVIISAFMHTTWFRLLFFNDGFGRRGLFYLSLELTSLSRRLDTELYILTGRRFYFECVFFSTGLRGRVLFPLLGYEEE